MEAVAIETFLVFSDETSDNIFTVARVKFTIMGKKSVVDRFSDDVSVLLW